MSDIVEACRGAAEGGGEGFGLEPECGEVLAIERFIGTGHDFRGVTGVAARSIDGVLVPRAPREALWREKGLFDRGQNAIDFALLGCGEGGGGKRLNRLARMRRGSGQLRGGFRNGLDAGRIGALLRSARG